MYLIFPLDQSPRDPSPRDPSSRDPLIPEIIKVNPNCSICEEDETKTRMKSDKGSLSQEVSLPFGYKRCPGVERGCAQRVDHGMIEK